MTSSENLYAGQELHEIAQTLSEELTAQTTKVEELTRQREILIAENEKLEARIEQLEDESDRAREAASKGQGEPQPVPPAILQQIASLKQNLTANNQHLHTAEAYASSLRYQLEEREHAQIDERAGWITLTAALSLVAIVYALIWLTSKPNIGSQAITWITDMLGILGYLLKACIRVSVVLAGYLGNIGGFAIGGILILAILAGIAAVVWGVIKIIRNRYRHYRETDQTQSRLIWSGAIIMITLGPAVAIGQSGAATWLGAWLALSVLALIIYHASPEAPRWLAAQIAEQPLGALAVVIVTLALLALIYLLTHIPN